MEITKRLKIIIIALVSVILIFSLLLALEINGVYTKNTDKSITVLKGEGFYNITDKLKEEGIIGNKGIFKVYTRLFYSDKTSNIKPGTYDFNGRMSYGKIIDALGNNPRVATVTITVPEGYELREIAALMEKNGLCTKEEFYEAANNLKYDFKYKNQLKNSENPLEGFLFPDTYVFEKEATGAELIIKTMLKRFEEIYSGLESIKTDYSVYEIITLASVIEREAMYEDDFYKVSSVFHNRLKRDDHLSYLQSCATVQYILKERKTVLSIADTKIDSPYNTYKYPGLPKGPIASPGALAIKAALSPVKSDYLYFLNDKDGKLHFSKTLSEHNAKVNKYVN
ncbi:MAG: endolytic transglycosylase MltG [Ruminococcaceae bacterium]|nr:endolytic transglycosylase MltG [Oscillospiraceae bacterium]